MFRKNHSQAKFLLTWKTFPWINEVREDVYCRGGKFKINGGLSQKLKHTATAKHQSMENKMKNQIRITSTTHSNQIVLLYLQIIKKSVMVKFNKQFTLLKLTSLSLHVCTTVRNLQKYFQIQRKRCRISNLKLKWKIWHCTVYKRNIRVRIPKWTIYL